MPKQSMKWCVMSGSHLPLCRTLAIAIAFLIAAVDIGESQTTPAAQKDSEAIIRFLEQTIDWYRQQDAQRQMATEPSESLLVNQDQQWADQVVRLAFDFARAAAESMQKQAGTGAAESGNTDSSRYEALRKRTETLDQQIKQTKQELESQRQKLLTAEGRQRQNLRTQIAEIQSELDLAEVRRDSLRSMVDFVGGSSTSGLGATGLRAQIEALARSVPSALTKTAGSQEGVAKTDETILAGPAASTQRTEPTGIWGLTADIFVLSRKTRLFAGAIQTTDSLSQSVKELQSPLVNRLREISRRGEDLAKQADSANETELAQVKKDLDALTAEFKRNSTSLLPLSKMRILLDVYRKNLASWQSGIKADYSERLRSLVLKLAFLVLFLAAIIGAAELWRRTILRYVQDLHRRHQLLLLKRIVQWCAIAIVIVLAFVNELGPVATFAGLITAGVAVALQNVILSAVGYFLLIGKFGIRVGDRVQVSGVTGEVVDIGLLRFHLLELISGGGKIPSGRMAAFSNSIVFQASGGLFKQVPGTNFVWHEVTLAMSQDSDYSSVEKRLREVVDAVFSGGRELMEQQRRQLEKTLVVAPVGELQPKCRLRLTSSSLEAVLRYPVDLQHAAEIDDRVTRELLKAIEREPKLKLAGSGAPSIKLRTDLSGSDPSG
ncbi:MAG TPA: mechanosensitive ion channel domain-containing protein [Acidobacteriota bacterium]|nr:mechanosensitive ion channel domain-containing protein [Acidobacteriota bacterium]